MPGETAPETGPPAAYLAYKARTGPAGEILKAALRRSPGDTAAWDRHAAELKAAWREWIAADPQSAREFLDASVEQGARLGTPPAPDNRTDAQKASDARFGIL